MPRFYYPGPLFIGATLELPDAIAHHVQVLRLSHNDTVTLFNNQGGEFVACLRSIEKKRVTAEINTFSSREAELPYAITLAQALPEASKMDWIIEKAVELGAIGIQPLSAQRCVVRLSAERAARKILHWQAIVVAASEQCGRNRLAHLAPLIDFKSWIAQQDLQCRILLSPHAQQSLSDWARHQTPQAISLLIGPEGGFTETEESTASTQGVLALSMGSRVLRTETAGLVAIATLNALWQQA